MVFAVINDEARTTSLTCSVRKLFSHRKCTRTHLDILDARGGAGWHHIEAPPEDCEGGWRGSGREDESQIVRTGSFSLVIVVITSDIDKTLTPFYASPSGPGIIVCHLDELMHGERVHQLMKDNHLRHILRH